MTDQVTKILSDIESGLKDNEEAISSVENFMATHAGESSKAVDPTQLLVIRDKIKKHTDRLSDLLLKFPIVQ